MVINKEITITTRGNCDIIDITDEVAEEISRSNVSNGIVTLFIQGSTAGISTIEYEGGLVSDYKEMWERNVPADQEYHHNLRWGDGNGHAHVRASLQGPSLVIPFVHNRLTLGTWQQIVVTDFDNRPRSRKVVIQIMGD